jgi:hypothetical protein
VPLPQLLTATIAVPLPPLPCCCHHRRTAATSVAVLPTPPATAATAALTVTFIFLSSSPPPTMLRCHLASGDAAALLPTWLWRRSNVPFLWHGEAAKNRKNEGMAAKFGCCGISEVF